MNGNRIKLMLVFGLWLVMGGCKPKKPEFGSEFNPVRKQVNLPLIDPEWKAEIIKKYDFNPSIPNRYRWRSQKNDLASKTNDHEKMVHYLPGKILWEEDVYFRLNDKWIRPNDIDQTEDITSLTTRYYFIPYTDRYGREHHDQGWECELNDPKHHFTKGGPLKITLAQADSVLHTWGVKRLTP